MIQVMKTPPLPSFETPPLSSALSSKTPRRLPAIDESKEPVGEPARLLSPDQAAVAFANNPLLTARRASICASAASIDEFSPQRRLSLAGLPPDVIGRRNSMAPPPEHRGSPSRSPMMGRMSLTSPASSLSKASSDAESDDDRSSSTDTDKTSDKTEGIRALLAGALKANVLVNNLDRGVIDQVVQQMWHDTLLAGQHLLEEGDQCDKIYILEKGEVQIQMSPRARRPVRTLGPGALLAEVALLHDGPAAQAIVCKTDIAFWIVEGAVFRSIVQEATKRRIVDHEELLAHIPFFRLMEPNDISRLADAVKPQSFADGDTILKVNEPETALFIVESGAVRSTREVRNVGGAIAPKAPAAERTMVRGTPLTSSGTFSASQANLLRVLEGLDDISSEPERAETTTTNSELLKRGDYFGEISIISRAPSEANYTAIGPTQLLVISKELLEDLFDITSIEEIVRSTLRHRRKIAPLALKSPPPIGRHTLPGIAPKAPLPALNPVLSPLV
eukprot:TRINITY_DN6519_c0_g1_i1.p1 TRINITY_DN6519_c0_g1~~TRINITY_DN6519_c0_g1_i1.p1  ORF type:complete len:504 (-),score=118.96 TRINITY_DN6519_c0_g1_i1:422-1933(-)